MCLQGPAGTSRLCPVPFPCWCCWCGCVRLRYVCGGRETVTPANNNDEAPLVDTDAAEVEKQTVSLFSM